MTPRRRGPHGFRATGLARTTYRRRMLTCSPAWHFGVLSVMMSMVAADIPPIPLQLLPDHRGVRRAVGPVRGGSAFNRHDRANAARVRAAALRAAGAGGWLAQHVDRPVAPLGADGEAQTPAGGKVDGCERQRHRCAGAQFLNEPSLGPAIKGVPPCQSDSTTSHRRFSAGAPGAAIGPAPAG